MVSKLNRIREITQEDKIKILKVITDKLNWKGSKMIFQFRTKHGLAQAVVEFPKIKLELL